MIVVWTHRCTKCGHAEPCEGGPLPVACPLCGAETVVEADEGGGGHPSEGHAGPSDARVSLESASKFSGPETPLLVEGEGEAEADEGSSTGGPGSDDDEVPITAYISARRWTRALKKFLRTWPGGVYHVACVSCGLDCVIAKSSHQELSSALDRGERWEVICDECREVVAPNAPLGMTEGQAEEVSRVARTLDAQERSN